MSANTGEQQDELTQDAEQNAQEPQREEPKPPEPIQIDAVMAVVAHPDDAEFSCAGTLAKYAREGEPVYIVICTAGKKGTPDPQMKREHPSAMRDRK